MANGKRWKLSLRLSPRILRQRSGSATMRRSVRSNSSRKPSPRPGCRSSYHNAAASSSSSASGWLTTCMKFGANVLDSFRYRTAVDLSGFYLTGTAVNDVLPLRLGVRVHGIVEAGNELSSQVSPVRLRQGQHFGDFFSDYAHA